MTGTTIFNGGALGLLLEVAVDNPGYGGGGSIIISLGTGGGRLTTNVGGNVVVIFADDGFVDCATFVDC